MYLIGINLAGGQVETCIMGLMPATCEDCFTGYFTSSGVKAFLDNFWNSIHRSTAQIESTNRFQDWIEELSLIRNVWHDTEAATDSISVQSRVIESV